ncbi:alpha/beta hydrolase [Pseudoalteromonas aurantia]|uniref:Hydrolase n=1 Tax=Pseudoalteromonas aurantia TaxID=43654 RepID=A0ABY2W1M7_9GAMM|nr:alpha/beta hydrolase-fold protein [Pseudoalteromonas aurantia]TMO78061.1 hydrolase [Pseudoalteromonas aurantia]
MTIQKHFILVLSYLVTLLIISVAQAKEFHLPNTHIVSINDTQLARQYELLITLPDGYNKNAKKPYPVVYYTDAPMHVSLLSSASNFILNETILVGISWQTNTTGALKKRGVSASRVRDYSINESSNAARQAKYQYGQASTHLAFIRNTVFQYIEKNYAADPSNRTYFGFSLGGLFGAYILTAHPDTFKNYILGSPALRGDIPLLTKLSNNHTHLNANVFISYGALESKLADHVNEFIDVLQKRNDNSLKLQTAVIDAAGHSDSFPMVGVRSIMWLSSLTDIKTH